MRYLCLIYFDEQKLAEMPPAERNTLNAAHLDFNDSLRASSHFIVAEALDPPASGVTIRMRDGRPFVTDGPFAETKEMLAGKKGETVTVTGHPARDARKSAWILKVTYSDGRFIQLSADRK